LVEHELGGHEVEGLGEPGSKGLREVGHGIPRRDALFVNPLENLGRAEGRLAVFGETRGERVEGLAGERRFLGRKLHGATMRRSQRFTSVRLRALTMALIEASSILVSMPAPKSVVPRSVLIWM